MGDDLEELANPPIALWSNVETDRIPEKAVEIDVTARARLTSRSHPQGCCAACTHDDAMLRHAGMGITIGSSPCRQCRIKSLAVRADVALVLPCLWRRVDVGKVFDIARGDDRVILHGHICLLGNPRSGCRCSPVRHYVLVTPDRHHHVAPPR